MQKAKINNAMEDAVLAALCYADIFDFSPSFDELPLYLPYVRMDAATRRATVSQLVGRGRMGHSEPYLFLPGRQDLVTIRQRRAKRTEQHWQLLEQHLPALLSAPWIKGAMLSGSLAANNPNRNADADLFLILDHRRMWLAYLLVRLMARRVSAIEVCPNYAVSDRHQKLLFPNLFTAIEWGMSVPLKVPDTLAALEQNNQWYRELVPNAPAMNDKHRPMAAKPKPVMRMLGWLVNSPLGWLLDRLEYYRLRKRTEGLYFPKKGTYKPHPPLRQHKVFLAWLERLDRYAVSCPRLREHIRAQCRILKEELAKWAIHDL